VGAAAPAPQAAGAPNTAGASRRPGTVPSRDIPRSPAPLPITRAEPTLPRSSTEPSHDLDRALYYHRAGDFENALQHYRALLQKDEMNAQAHNNLGLLYQEKKLYEESSRELQRAILIEPRSVRARNNFGVTLLLQGKPDEAAAMFRSALTLEPRNVDALVNLALAQRDGVQPEVAIETLLDALTVAPRSPVVHYNLGQLYDRSNERARAVEHYRKFLENAGTEHASRAPAVRSRIDALSRIPD
jgi:Tfp pilus assembly protein PilF